MMTERQILDAVFTMARVGLMEIAKDLRNGPLVIANQAAALEQWRVNTEESFAAAEKDKPVPE